MCPLMFNMLGIKTYIHKNFTCSFFYHYTDPIIGSVLAMPESFLGLETSCPDSYSYSNFTLTCTAVTPNSVLLNLVLVWTHNGTVRNGTVSTITSSNVTTFTNILSFSTSVASDSGTYRCFASTNAHVFTSENVTITLRCKYNTCILQ